MLKFIPKIILLTTFITLAIIFGVMMLKADQHEKQQASNWIDSLRRSILPQLIESDYVPLYNKIDLVKRTGLFTNISVYNKKDALITSFGDESKEICSSGSEKHITDEAGTIWGKICYSVTRLSTFKIFELPFVMIAIILIILSGILSKSISIIIDNENKKRFIENEKAILIQTIASQVAHDIRSPLAALEMIMGTSQRQVPVSEREIMRNALNRIKDIANNLLSKPSTLGEKFSEVDEQSSIQITRELIVPLVESVISETRARFMDYSKVKIECEIIKSAATTFIEVDRREFKRVISNILNNSVEAKNKDNLIILVKIFVDEAQVKISIKDNGKGIPDSVLRRLGKPGISYGKESHPTSGNGLGLSHAMNAVKNWHGEIKVESIMDEGTECTIGLKLTQPAEWFPVSIEVDSQTLIVVCDDDLAIHSIWQNRFQDYKTLHFNSLKELRDFYRKNFSEIDRVLYLIDYTFFGESKTGLDVILDLGLESPENHSKSILVTSYYEDEEVRTRCIQNNLSLLPKTMSGFIPIHKVNAIS